MKKFSHAINITNGNNYFITHTESDWSAGRRGSLVSIGDDNHFYTVGEIEDINFITDFVYNGLLVLNGDFEEIFLTDDILTISYKEYHAFIIKNIVQSGTGYQVGDVLTCSGGDLSVNIIDNSKTPVSVKVETVDHQGGIISVSLLRDGKYTSPPTGEIPLSGGHGSGASITIDFDIIKNRAMLEKQVVSSKHIDGNTLIEINYMLPAGVKEGKISLRKNKVYLTGAYVGPTKRNIHFHVARDQSPNLRLPLLLKNSNKNEESINFAFLALDKEIALLKEEIAALKKIKN